MKKLNDLSFGLICVLYLCMSVCAYGAPVPAAAKRSVTVNVTKYGELVYSHSGKVASLDESLADMMVAQGAMQVRANPLTVILALITHNAIPSSNLNPAALNEFFAQAGVLGVQDQVNSVVPALTRKVNLNLGTLESLPSIPWNIHEMRASLIWHNVPTIARKFTAGLDPLVQTLLANWLKGAKQSANEIKPALYARFPLLAEARVVEEFQTLSVQHMVAVMFVTGCLYDYGAIAGDNAMTKVWEPALNDGNEQITPASTKSLSPEEVLQAPVKAIGASNGSAMVVKLAGRTAPVSVSFLEPHQATSAGTESTNNIMLLNDGTGRTVPLEGFQFPGIPGAFGIHQTEKSAISGTAGPAFASLRFFVELVGQQGLAFRDPADGQTKNFALRPISIPDSSGQMVQVNVRGIGVGASYAGEVYMMKKDPASGKRYAFGIRSNKTANVANNMWNLIIAGLKRDAVKFKATLRDGLNLWASAGVFADGTGAQHTYNALFQGRPDQVAAQNGAVLNAGTVNPALFPKTGEQPTPMCVDPRLSSQGTSVASANNGPVGNNCGPQKNWEHVDPAHINYIPHRQQDVINFFTSRNLAEQSISEADLKHFITSTSSTFVAKMNEIAIASTYTFGAQLVGTEMTADELGLATAVASVMIGNDGSTKADPFTIILFHMKTDLETAIISGQGINATVSNYIKGPSNITLQQAAAAIDLPTARLFAGALNNAIKFVLNKCLLEAGKLNWNEIVTIKAYGRTIATGAGGAAFGGFDSQNLNNYRFEKDANGALTCAVVSESSSPVKLYRIAEKSCVSTHGGFLNPVNELADGIYETQIQAWGEKWSKMNRSTGDADDGYVCRNIGEGLTKEEFLGQFKADIVKSYTIVVN